MLLGTGAISVTSISLDYHVEHGPGQHIGRRRTLDATGLSKVPTDDAVYVPSGGAGQHCKVLDAAGDSVEIALDSQTHTWVRREDVLGCGPRIDCLAATPHTANATAASRSFEASLLEIFSGEGHLSGAVARAGGGVLPAIDKIHGDDLTSPATRDRVLKRLTKGKPAVLWVAFPCLTYSVLQRMRKHQHEPKITKLRAEANKLLQHMKPIVPHALETGSQLVFENPGGSALWASNGFRAIIDAAKKLGRPLRRIDHDQCMFAEDGAEPRDVYKKATAFFTTMPRAWTAHLEKRCTHGRGAHKPCVGWRTKGVSNAAHSAAYPNKL